VTNCNLIVGTTPFVVLLTLPALAAGQTSPAATPEINTDRPDITESSVVIPRASLQIENGATWTSDHGNQSADFTETLIRFGILSRTELRIAVPNYSAAIGGAEAFSGFGDLSLGLKQQLGPLPGDFDLAVIMAVSLPTGQYSLTSGGYDPFAKFPWSKELGDGWSIGGQQSLFWDTQARRRNGIWEPTFYLERQLGNHADVFVEYAGDYLQHGEAKQILHFGAPYRITTLHQVDFHFGFGLNTATPNHFFAIGYSFRLDRLWK
jgi:hypothetical protein